MNRAEFEVFLRDKVTPGARRAGNAVDMLHRKMADKGATRRALREQRRMQESMQFRQTASVAGGVFGGQLAYDALRTGVGLMFRLAKGIAAATYESVTFAQNQEMAYDQLAKHGVKGTELFNHVRASAQAFGLDVKDTTKQYAKFLSLQFNPREADKLIAMGADLRAMGTDAEGIKGVFTALGQIKSKGRLQAEELLQLSERNISGKVVQEEIGKILGKTQDEVRKLQEQGKVDAETALLGIEKAINRKLGQSKLGETGARYAEQTIEGARGRFMANWDNLWIGLGQRSQGAFGESANKLVSKFETWVGSGEAESMMANLADGVNDFAVGLGRAVDVVDRFGDGLRKGHADAEPLVALMKGFDDARSVDSLRDTADQAERVGRVLAFVGTAAGTAKSILFDLATGPAIAVANAGNTILESWGRIGNIWEVRVADWPTRAAHIGYQWVVGMASGVMQAMFLPLDMTGNLGTRMATHLEDLGRKAPEWGRAVMQGLADGITDAITIPIDATSKAVSDVIATAKQKLGIQSPSREFAEIGRQTQAGMALGIEQGAGMASKASGSAALAALGAARRDAPVLSSDGAGRLGAGAVTGLAVRGPFVHVEVHASSAEGDAIAESLAPVIETQVESLLSRWADQIGAPA